MLLGDFNDIAYGSEKKGGGALPLAKMNRFVENIERCRLMDLAFCGTKFTWKGPRYHGGITSIIGWIGLSVTTCGGCVSLMQ